MKNIYYMWFSICTFVIVLCFTNTNSEEFSCYTREQNNTTLQFGSQIQNCTFSSLQKYEECSAISGVTTKSLYNAEIQYRNYSRSLAAVDISFPFESSRSISLVIFNAVKCWLVNVSILSEKSWNGKKTFHINNLKLPVGHYRLIGIINDKFFHLNQEFEIKESNSRGRREPSLVGGGSKNCSCESCFKPSHRFYRNSALLQFHLILTDESCCQDFSVQLLQRVDPTNQLNKKNCEIHPGIPDANSMTTVGGKRVADKLKIPVDFPNTAHGCYMVRINHSFCKEASFHGFFWIPKSSNYIELRRWNVSMNLVTRYSEKTVDVSWRNFDGFNFTEWSLKLWYSKNYKINCVGNNKNERIDFILTDTDVISTNIYSFQNLSEGYYCARITPMDIGCPRLGCATRSSSTVYLEGPLVSAADRAPKHNLMYWLIALLVLIAIIGGICLAFLCYRHQKTLQRDQVTYSSVTQNYYPMEPVPILLVWTRFMSGDVNIEPVVKSFKEILTTYSKCKVFDYLDSFSMDKHQRQLLMSDPTEWLRLHMRNTKEKIIFIGTEGAYKRQVENRFSNGKRHECLIEDPVDQLLFPSVLRFINDSRSQLSSDYRRIFYVKFYGLGGSELETDGGLVPRMRFTVPYNMRSLTLKLHGLPDDSDFPEPPDSIVSSLLQRIKETQNKSHQVLLNDTSTFTTWKPD